MDGELETESLRAEIRALRASLREQRSELLAAKDRALETAKRADALTLANAALEAELSAFRDRERRRGLFARLRKRRMRPGA